MHQERCLTNGSFFGAPPPTNGKDSASPKARAKKNWRFCTVTSPETTLGEGHCQMISPHQIVGGGHQILVTPPNEILGRLPVTPRPPPPHTHTQKFWGGHRQKVTPLGMGQIIYSIKAHLVAWSCVWYVLPDDLLFLFVSFFFERRFANEAFEHSLLFETIAWWLSFFCAFCIGKQLTCCFL